MLFNNSTQESREQLSGGFWQLQHQVNALKLIIHARAGGVDCVIKRAGSIGIKSPAVAVKVALRFAASDQPPNHSSITNYSGHNLNGCWSRVGFGTKPGTPLKEATIRPAPVMR